MLHIIIGTEAELIKVFPLMIKLTQRGIDYNFISTGQHDLTKSQILTNFKLRKPDIILHRGKTYSSLPKMVWWFGATLIKSWRLDLFKDKSGLVLVHGDTISTLLGALLTKKSGLRLGHIEAGLRSYKLFDPFPEEITRRIVTFLSDYLFIPGEWAQGNLKDYPKDRQINIGANTLYESLHYLKKSYLQRKLSFQLPSSYFIFVLHRTENLLNRRLCIELINCLTEWSKQKCGVVVLHHTTEEFLIKYKLLKQLQRNSRIVLIRRLEYADFMKVLSKASFVATDGGSNQEECYYLGVPTIILRQTTERIEGLGYNVLLSKLNLILIRSFDKIYTKFRRGPHKLAFSPSEKIIQFLKAQSLV